MRSSKKLVSLVITWVLFMNCSSNDTTTQDAIIVYQKDTTEIILISVDDSRCPTNMDCIWEGNAEVGLRIKHRKETEDFILNTLNSNEYPSKLSLLGLEIELIDILPFPKAGNIYSLKDYTINLNVKE